MDKNDKISIKYNSDGRITIPRSIRRLMNLKGGQEFDLTVVDNKIVLEPVQKRCSVCGKTEGIVEIKSGETTIHMCKDCLTAIKRS